MRKILLQQLANWFKNQYPHLPFLYFGESGATLLYNALIDNKRSTLIMSTFICHEIAFMAEKAGKKVIHIDINPETLHMDSALIQEYLAQCDPTDSILLVDHSFGYPYLGLPEIKETYPDLLIIEDCVRALGAKINQQAVGFSGDWVLFSMYKTIPGCTHGIALLAPDSLNIQCQTIRKTTLREIIAAIDFLRFFYGYKRKKKPMTYTPDLSQLKTYNWLEHQGLPNTWTLFRFFLELKFLSKRFKAREKAIRFFSDELQAIDYIQPIKIMDNSTLSGCYFSFLFSGNSHRDEFLGNLHQQGHFLLPSWEKIPTHYSDYLGQAPFGFTGAHTASQQIIHIPIGFYLNPLRRQHLVNLLKLSN